MSDCLQFLWKSIGFCSNDSNVFPCRRIAAETVREFFLFMAGRSRNGKHLQTFGVGGLLALVELLLLLLRDDDSTVRNEASNTVTALVHGTDGTNVKKGFRNENLRMNDFISF